ncbi:MAG: RNA polymerase sigma factor [Gemmatimonadaceae bacterium]|nr:RNA polymerase sigma factor [Chitinophagaceae bacterium]
MEISELVKKAKQGKPEAQKKLFELLSGKMATLCRRYVRNTEDAEELLLDGFYKFFINLPGFIYSSEAGLYAWLKRIMINECLMFLRKKNLFLVVDELQAEHVPLEEDALNRLSATEIFNLIIQLPTGYRTVFNLYEIEGMKHQEISALLGIAEGTSKSQLSKAKTLLQKLLAQNHNDYVATKTK